MQMASLFSLALLPLVVCSILKLNFNIIRTSLPSFFLSLTIAGLSLIFYPHSVAQAQHFRGTNRNIFGVNRNLNIHARRTIRRNVLGRNFTNQQRLYGVNQMHDRMYGMRRFNEGRWYSRQFPLRSNYFGKSRIVELSRQALTGQGRTSARRGSADQGEVIPMSKQELARNQAFSQQALRLINSHAGAISSQQYLSRQTSHLVEF